MVRSTLTFIPFIWLHHQSFEMGDRWSIQFPRQPCHDDCSCHVMWGIATLKDSQSSWQPCWGRWTKGRKYPEVAWIHSVSLSLPVLILPDQLCTVVLRTSQWLIYLDRLLKTISVSRYGCFWTHTKKTEYNTPHRPPCWISMISHWVTVEKWMHLETNLEMTPSLMVHIVAQHFIIERSTLGCTKLYKTYFTYLSSKKPVWVCLLYTSPT